MKAQDLDRCAAGLNQATSVDAKHWGGYCLWQTPFADERRLLKMPSAGARRGRALRVIGDLAGAQKVLRAAVKAAPKDGYAAACLAETQWALGLPGWKKAFDQAQAVDSSLPWARLWGAAAELAAGDAAGARKRLAGLRDGRAGALEPVLSGIAALNCGDAAEAAGHFSRACALDAENPGSWIMLGRAALVQGDEKAAVAAFERAIRIDHDCKVAYYAFLGCGDLPDTEEGLARLDAALKKRPGAPWALALRGELLRMPGLARYDEAIADLRRAVAAAPKRPWLHAFLARALGNTGRGREGLACMERALKLDPHCSWLHAWKGEALRKAGRGVEAKRCLTRAVALDQRYLFGFAWRGTVLNAEGKSAAALRDLDRALALNPWYELAYAERARARLLLGDGSGACADMTLAARLNPKYGWVQTSGRPGPETEEIVAALDKACRRAPKLAALRAWRGETLLRLGRLDEAIIELTKALALEPAAWTYAWRGEAQVRQQKPAEALPDLERAVKLDPDYARAWGWKGAALHRLGRFEPALVAYGRAAKLDGKSAWIFAWRARAALDLKRWEAGLADAERALALDRGYVEAWLWRAEALRALKRWNEAAESCSRALKLDPHHAQAFVGRAVALQQAGDSGGALLDFARAQRLDPALLPAEARANLAAQLLSAPAALLKAGQAAQAAAAVERVLEADPASAAAFLLRCEARRTLKDLRALEDLEAARALNEHGALLYLSGRFASWEELGRLCETGAGPLSAKPSLTPRTYESSARVIDELLALGGKGSAWLWALRGESSLKAQRVDDAARDLTRAVKMAPAHAKARAWLGECHYRRGSWKEALAQFDAAVAADPKAAGLLAWRGQLKLWLGLYARAVQDLEKALTLDPRYGWAYGWRGACRFKLGDVSGAAADLEKALSLDARDSEALLWRAELALSQGRGAEAARDAAAAALVDAGNLWAPVLKYLGSGAAADLDALRGPLSSLLPGHLHEAGARQALDCLREAGRGDRVRMPGSVVEEAVKRLTLKWRAAAGRA